MNLSDRKSVDAELRSVHDWIEKATGALLSFADLSRGTFWRDNDKRAESQKLAPEDPTLSESPTSTRRSFIALVSMLHAAGEENAKQRKVIKGEADSWKAVNAVAKFYLDRPLATIQSRSKSDNAFMDAQLLLAAAMLRPVNGAPNGPKLEAIDALVKRFDPVKEKMLGILRDRKGIPVQYGESASPHAADEDPHRHDFITLHGVRALDALGCQIDPDIELALQKRLRADVLRQLGYKMAEISSRFDPSELAFTITLLNRQPTAEAEADIEPLTAAAVDTIVQAQLPSGAWQPARPVVYSQHDDILHINSFDVALALSYLLRAHATKRHVPFRSKLLDALGKTFTLIKSSYRVVANAKGWVNDHARSELLVESWTTAVVLMFLTQYRELLFELRQAEILDKYHAETTLPNEAPDIRWRDLRPLIHLTQLTDGDPLDDFSDPTDGRALTRAMKEKFVNPVRNSWYEKPRKASLIVYGAPGTRKTSLVKSIAKALQWPLVTITPPNFLQKGLDGFESVAADVFEDLFRLRRVVVFFDECEDFFKKRPSEQQLENRTIGAFITAGMLPRLQHLRDRGWVIFVVATNSALTDLDEAVMRPGRFDFAYEMKHPTSEAAKRYVIDRLEEEDRTDLREVVEKSLGLIDFEEHLPSFTILERLVVDLVDGSVAPTDVPTIVAHIDALRTRSWPESLVPA